MYDYQLVLSSGKPEFKQWSDVVPTFSYNKALPYFQVRVHELQTGQHAANLGPLA